MFELLLGTGDIPDRVIKGWTELDNQGMTNSRYSAMATVGDDLYIFGGASTPNRVQDLWKYNTITKERTLMPVGPTGRSEPAMTAWGNNLYIIGGWPSPEGVTDEVHIFNTLSKTWSRGTSYPVKITNARAVTVGIYIYVAGGAIGGSTTTTALYRYQPNIDQWVVMTPMPQAISAGAWFSLDGKYIFYAMGRTTRAVYRYDISKNSWDTQPNGPGDYFELHAPVVNGKAYIWSSGTLLPAPRLLYVFDGTTWKTMPQKDPYPNIRYGCALGAVGYSLFMFGGVIESTYNNGFWQYEL